MSLITDLTARVQTIETDLTARVQTIETDITARVHSLESQLPLDDMRHMTSAIADFPNVVNNGK